jgi:hypothetical protein
MLKLNIGISGRVKHVQLEGPPQFRQLEPCLKEVVGRWVFPQNSEEYGTELPLVFRAGALEDTQGQRVSVPEICSMTIDSAPPSDLWIDGKNTGRRTPVHVPRVRCGKHKLGFKRADLHIDRTKVIRLRPGKPFEPTYKLNATRTASRR